MRFGRAMSEKQMIRALEKRLQWLMNEADEDEFDSKEATAIVDLLEAMDPLEKREGEFFTPQKANDRFWTFYVFRDRNDDEKPPYDNFATRAKLKLKRFIYGNAFARVSFVAMLLVAIVFGGTLVVFAQKEGFFHWSIEEENDIVAITVPTHQNLDNADRFYFDSLDDVPIKYLKYVWVPNKLFADYELKTVYIYNDSTTITVESLFRLDETKFIKFIKKDFGGVPTITSQTYDSFDHVDTQTICDVEVTYLKKTNDDYNEYMVSFCIENAIYFVHSNEGINDITSLVSSCIEELLK